MARVKNAVESPKQPESRLRPNLNVCSRINAFYGKALNSVLAKQE